MGSWSLEEDGSPSLDPSRRAGEPYSKKAQELWYYPGGVYGFLFRLAFVATTFLLAMLIAYLAH